MIFGVDRLVSDLLELGHNNAEPILDPNNIPFGLIKGFEVGAGRFAGKLIDLAIPAPPEYGRLVGSAIHVRSTPHLLDKSDTVPGVRNITDSTLGSEWRYWSHQFIYYPEDTTKLLMLQINGVFRHA
jgi:hypothetical protein